MLNLREFAFAVFDSFIVLDGDSALVGCDSLNDSSISVEDVFIVVVASLYDLIANTVNGTTIFYFDW